MANQGQAPNRALATTRADGLARFSGALRDPKEVNAKLAEAAQSYHLVSPAPACGIVPEGCTIAFSPVLVDAANETYDTGGGKLGLSKTALDRIASAAGISWDARQSGRLDDGSDPNYCAWRAVGRMRHLDGTEVQLVATKEMDLRPGSPQVIALEERAKNARPPRDASKQIREMRLHIMAHAETKARLRAIRSIGIRSSYTAKDLEKAFVVAKLQWTGYSDDPELRRAFALKQADAMLGGSRALYGDTPMPTPQAVSMLGTVRPPPVGASMDDDDAPESPRRLPNGAPRTVEAPPPSEPKTTGRQATPPPKSEPKSADTSDEAERPTGPLARFGRCNGQPLASMDDENFDWYLEAVRGNVDDPKKSRFKADNEAHLRECLAEEARRNAANGDDRGDEADRY